MITKKALARVINEKRELDIKISRLIMIIGYDEPAIEDIGMNELLHHQLQAMNKYSRILGQRIKLMESDNGSR